MSMPVRYWPLVILVLCMTGCGTSQNLNMNLKLDHPAGLQPSAPVMLGENTVGSVTAVKTDSAGGIVASLVIQPDFRDQATEGSRFSVVRDPADDSKRRVVIRPGSAHGQPLENGAKVKGSDETAQLPAIGDLLKGLSQGVGALSGVFERLRSGFQNLPSSGEASRAATQFTEGLNQLSGHLDRLRQQMESKENTEEVRRMREQWSRLQDDMKNAQGIMEKAMREEVIPKLEKEVIPRLQEEMGALEKSARKMEAKSRPGH
jgi:hypothetical protein